jgi:selT/selW/selH-like putative selenoprotein
MFLQNEFPQLIGKISGEHYPTPPLAELVSHIVALLQMLGLACMVVGGDALCRMLGLRQAPAFVRSMQENSIQYGILLFLLMPQLMARFSQSGAFEVYLNNGQENEGVLIFSKLAEGRLPEKADILQKLVAAGLQAKL